MQPKIILVFGSIHYVLKAEQVLQKASMPFELIPVPKEVNPDCGMAIEIDPALADEAAEMLNQSGLTIEARYKRAEKNFEALNIA